MSHCGMVKAILQKTKDKLEGLMEQQADRVVSTGQGRGGVWAEALGTGMRRVPQKPLLS